MIRFSGVFVFTLSLLFCHTADAELKGTFPAGGGPITIQTTEGPIDGGGLKFIAEKGSLSNGSQPAPFQFYITGNDTEGQKQVIVGSLKVPKIDGKITLDISASANAVIRATWGKGTTPVSFDVVAVSDVAEEKAPKKTGEKARQDEAKKEGEKKEAVPELKGTFPVGGGPITIQTTEGPIDCGGLDFIAEKGSLSNGSQPAPFHFYVTGNDTEGRKQVTVGSLKARKIDGKITLDVSASANAVIKATWGKGTKPVPFEVVAVPADTAKDDAKKGVKKKEVVVPELIGTFPAGGGPITIQTKEAAVMWRARFQGRKRQPLKRQSASTIRVLHHRQ